jgi:hypothetical protein
VLRHRTIGSLTITLDYPTTTRASRTIRQRPPRYADPISCWTVLDAPTSLPQKMQPQTTHWFVTVASGMLIAFLIMMIGQFVFSWIGTVVDTIRHGYPRTFQTDV